MPTKYRKFCDEIPFADLIALRDQGLSLRQIGAKYGFSHKTIMRRFVLAGVPRQRPGFTRQDTDEVHRQWLENLKKENQNNDLWMPSASSIAGFANF